MEFLWPWFLPIFAVIPILVLAYILILRRRKPNAVRYSSLSLVREALPKSSFWRRHLPFILFLLALSSLMMAFVRPVTVATLPVANATIILSIDVSRSMCSTDILPSRLEAAKSAALDFIEIQRDDAQIGIVAFAGFAVPVQEPTTNRADLEQAIRSLSTARRTAIGSGIIVALDVISEVDDNIQSPYLDVPVSPPPPGEYAPAIVVLLTDGVNTTGISPIEAAQAAADRGIRVYTIGFGTDHNTTAPNCGPQFSNPENFQFFGNGGGGGFRREIDEETLKEVAKMTGGTYHLAESADELVEVFQNLPTHLITKTETVEVSVIFVAIAALFITLAMAFSIIWHPLQ